MIRIIFYIPYHWAFWCLILFSDFIITYVNKCGFDFVILIRKLTIPLYSKPLIPEQSIPLFFALYKKCLYNPYFQWVNLQNGFPMAILRLV